MQLGQVLELDILAPMPYPNILSILAAEAHSSRVLRGQIKSAETEVVLPSCKNSCNVHDFCQLTGKHSLPAYQPISLPAYQPTSLPAYQPISLPAYQLIWVKNPDVLNLS